MAFLTIKAMSLLLIITLVFSSYGVAEANFWTKITKPFTGASKTKETVPASVINKLRPNPSSTGLPTLPRVTPTGQLMTTKKEYAKKAFELLFGPGGKKGFSYAWKGPVYYLKAANKCEKYSNTLYPKCKPLNVKLVRVDCVAKYCIVVAYTKMADDKTPPICYDGCEFPKEATCNGTRTIDKHCGVVNF